MQKTNKTIELLKPLFALVDFDLVSNLLAPIWRVVAAVHLFFPPGDHAGSHREVRAASGSDLSGVGQANRPVDVGPSRIA